MSLTMAPARAWSIPSVTKARLPDRNNYYLDVSIITKNSRVYRMTRWYLIRIVPFFSQLRLALEDDFRNKKITNS